VLTANLAKLYEMRPARPHLKALPEYPVSKRDLSLVAEGEVQFEDIEKSLVKNAGRLLESLQVFDVYRGEQIGTGKTAYGVRLSFRSKDKTLTDEEIDRIIDKVLTRLKNELSVTLRS